MRRSTVAAALAASLAAAVIAAPVAPVAAQALLFLEPETLRVSQILGREVQSREGASLGPIRDLLLDRKTRRVAFFALERGAYPVQALRAGEGSEVLLDAEDSASGGASAPMDIDVMRLSELMGRTLCDAAGVLIGPIRDVAVNALDGSLAFALVEATGGELRYVPAAEVLEERLR